MVDAVPVDLQQTGYLTSLWAHKQLLRRFDFHRCAMALYLPGLQAEVSREF
jgi:hypothetical protein